MSSARHLTGAAGRWSATHPAEMLSFPSTLVVLLMRWDHDHRVVSRIGTVDGTNGTSPR